MSFNFAITQRATVPRSNFKLAKLPVQNKKHLFVGPMKPPRQHDQPGSLVYAPIPEQIRLILRSGPRLKGFHPQLATLTGQVQLLSGYYMRLNALGFQISNVTNFKLKHAQALIAMWHADGCTTSDLCLLWNTLSFWTQTLGKSGLLASLEDATQFFTNPKCTQSQ